MTPRSWLRVAMALIAVALLLLPLYLPEAPSFFPGFWPDFDAALNAKLSEVIYLAIAAMGLNLLTGFNGQVSIGHGAFFGIGAFTTAILMDSYSWTFEATLPAAALLTALVGVVVGIPALRVRGLNLALVTLGLAVLFPRLVQKYVEGSGGVAVVRPDSDGFNSLVTFLDDDQWQYLECLIIAVILFTLAWNLTRSRTGRAMIAVRDQEIAASTVGMSLARVKVGTFAISAGYAGIAGSLSVMIKGAAGASDPTEAFRNSILFLVIVVIGGTATITGPAIGALILVLLQDETDSLIEGKEVLSPAIFGAALIAMVFLLPGGVVGGLRKLTDWLLPKDSGAAPPTGTDATPGLGAVEAASALDP